MAPLRYEWRGRGLVSGSGIGYRAGSSRVPRCVPGSGPIISFMLTMSGPSGVPCGRLRSRKACSGCGIPWSPTMRFSLGLSGLSVPPVPTMYVGMMMNGPGPSGSIRSSARRSFLYL